MKTKIKVGVIAAVSVLVIVMIFTNSEQEIVMEPITEIETDSIKNPEFYSPIVGSKDASVTIIAFNDYGCTECKYWYENIFPDVQKNIIDENKAKIIFVDISSTNQNSILMSQGTFCADGQNQYLNYQKILFNSQDVIAENASVEKLTEYASELGMNTEEFQECLNSKKFEKNVFENMKSSMQLGVQKIPIFKITNSEGREHVLKGSLPLVLFEETVERFR